MGRYLISDVERISGLKRHVLRRWEHRLPLFSPDKDYQGRRYYGDRDMETIARMKHLVYEQGLSEDAAADLLLTGAGASLSNSAVLAELREIREQLGSLYLSLKKQNGNDVYGKEDE
jgi:DNA-binding transcriptional MerR regulator